MKCARKPDRKVIDNIIIKSMILIHFFTKFNVYKFKPFMTKI